MGRKKRKQVSISKWFPNKESGVFFLRNHKKTGKKGTDSDPVLNVLPSDEFTSDMDNSDKILTAVSFSPLLCVFHPIVTSFISWNRHDLKNKLSDLKDVINIYHPASIVHLNNKNHPRKISWKKPIEYK
ncbi:hypothetical protein AVEN_188691-1 [Araneus ventricosus]|uniref:Uncharacterized protein n=1 Tax=Araneus ventricosus TaxID=182803 RepID=A0A4Y2D8V5_ARAVE|nr:hypothetical protein AVEN_188691-1 [Araneus ventricosus]